MNTTTDLRACARAAWCREPDSEAQQICVWQGQVRLRKQLVDSKMPPMPWSVPESMHMNLHFCIYFCCSIYPSVSLMLQIALFPFVGVLLAKWLDRKSVV